MRDCKLCLKQVQWEDAYDKWYETIHENEGFTRVLQVEESPTLLDLEAVDN